MSGELLVIGPQHLPYDDALALQHRLRDERVAGAGPDCLLLIEHPPTITLGVRADTADVLAREDSLAARGVCVRRTNRGGEVTFHGPGQLVAYPIVDLRRRGRNLHGYLRRLEAWLVRLCRASGISAHADSPHTGVWVADRKIASIGIAARHWIAYHGVALNVNTDMSYFDLIVPCGLHQVRMTSMEGELGEAPAFNDVARSAAEMFAQDFGMDIVRSPSAMAEVP